jgi:hypothetical protein
MMTAGDEIADEIDGAVDLWCHGHDADVGPRRRDLGEDVST